nr:aminotransferase class V-fold PLP-dependent enzyme [Rhodococcus sp. WWJCD1]
MWLDTPASPPGATPVVDAARAALEHWTTGRFDWLEWDHQPQRARTLIATLHNVQPSNVALAGSVSEAAATVASSLPPGRILILDTEYRSVLFPFMQLDPVRNSVRLISPRLGQDRTSALIEALSDDVVLVAVSEILSSDGERVDIATLRTATWSMGTRLFVDATQAMGSLHTDYAALGVDYVALHGYKWMLCPRGAAWWVVTDERLHELRPLMPGWKSTSLPHGYFGGQLELAGGAAKLDSSPAWFSWIGAVAALELQLRLNRPAVQEHVGNLRTQFVERAADLGLRAHPSALPSNIAVVGFDRIEGFSERLATAGIKATATDRRLRLGFHYFNDQSDIDAVIDHLSTALAHRRSSRT